MDRVDEKIVNYDLIEDILTTLLLEPSSAKMKLSFPESDCKELIVDGATLIFLPGLGEIRALSDRLRCNRHFSKRDAFEIIPLHSTISPRDQKRAFLKSKRGCRKIIISTNIAETSITIPDVVCGKLFLFPSESSQDTAMYIHNFVTFFIFLFVTTCMCAWCSH